MVTALRPMLKDWLDQNLPAMVERMITAEIQRVTRGGALASSRSAFTFSGMGRQMMNILPRC